jgi:thymidylate kinase
MSLIIIDGPNGSGKTTQKNLFAKDGFKTLSSPSGTRLSDYIRPACRGEGDWKGLNPLVQMFLFSAARINEYYEIAHGLPQNGTPQEKFAIADRWWTSSYVYQCCVGGISEEILKSTIPREEKIEFVAILKAEPETLIKRLRLEREMNNKHGYCQWTEDEVIIRSVIDYYYYSLPLFLGECGVDYYMIDAEHNSANDVKEIISDKILHHVMLNSYF